MMELSDTQLADVLKRSNTLFITLINYEERSLGSLELVRELNIRPDQIAFLIIELTSSTYKIDVLGRLKRNHFTQAYAKLLGGFTYERAVFEYPASLNLDTLKGEIRKRMNAYEKKYFNIVADVSCLPKALMYVLLEAIYSLWKDAGGRIKDVFAVYVQAGSYSRTEYAQVVGAPMAYFAKEELSVALAKKDEIEAVIIPGFEGYNSTAIYDAVTRSGKKIKIHLLLSVKGECFTETLKVMRANQLLLHLATRHDSAFVKYCFSFLGGMDALNKIAKNFVKRRPQPDKKLFLISPFGPKPFALAAYIVYREVRLAGMDAEIAHISGFQYTSTYSVGMGSISAFQLPTLEVKSDEQ